LLVILTLHFQSINGNTFDTDSAVDFAATNIGNYSCRDHGYVAPSQCNCTDATLISKYDSCSVLQISAWDGIWFMNFTYLCIKDSKYSVVQSLPCNCVKHNTPTLITATLGHGFAHIQWQWNAEEQNKRRKILKQVDDDVDIGIVQFVGWNITDSAGVSTWTGGSGNTSPFEDSSATINGTLAYIELRYGDDMLFGISTCWNQ